VVTPNFLFGSDSPCYDLLLPHSHKPRKNIVVLGACIVELCAVTKGGTVLNRAGGAGGGCCPPPPNEHYEWGKLSPPSFGAKGIASTA